MLSVVYRSSNQCRTTAKTRFYQLVVRAVRQRGRQALVVWSWQARVLCVAVTVRVVLYDWEENQLRSHSSPGAVEEALGLQGADMGTGRVGDLSQEQLMEGLSQLLDTKLSKLATKDDLLALSNKVNALEEENKALHKESIMLKSKSKVMSDKLVDLEGRSRRNNLIFKGLKFDQKSDCKQVVRKFCVDTLRSGDGLWVNRAHQLGRDRSTIIAHIPDSYIIPREIREKRAKLVAVRAEVERVSGRRRMPLAFDHLTIESVRQRLNELLGHDFSDFLRKLQEEQLRARTRAPGPGATTSADIGR
ncbi:hypothetical protein J6590_087445 [Homalodisca vitripennis]|nr:hypothetical protein J6590_087445 [Homalodisca vitripennis]